MARKLIPIPVKVTVSSMNGKVEEVRDSQMMMMPAAPGTCEVCATKHEASLPHNAQSLFYQMQFHAEHGRYPTWKDALAHCDDNMKAAWEAELRRRGAWTEPAAATPQTGVTT